MMSGIFQAVYKMALCTLVSKMCDESLITSYRHLSRISAGLLVIHATEVLEAYSLDLCSPQLLIAFVTSVRKQDIVSTVESSST